MSFTLDGQTIETEPATMARLVDGDTVIVPGDMLQVGDWTENSNGQLTEVFEVFRTEIVSTVHVD
jgi:hypothetical protein